MRLHLFVSPHFDDAVLSCGATMHRLRRLGERVMVLTVCAGVPDNSQSLATHARNIVGQQVTPEYTTALRHTEDQNAMECLGIEGDYLSIPDCIFRGDPDTGTCYYETAQQVFWPPHHKETELPKRIAHLILQRVRPFSEVKLYAPLGVGSHVDHFLCCQAAYQLHEHGHQVCFYEDFPYCDPSYPYTEPDEGVLHSSLAEELAKSHANLASRLLYLEDEDLNRKIEAILTYESQLDIVFTRNADIRSQVITYMKSLGSGKPVERFWVFGA